jgi:hypothetical protein
LQAKTKKIMDVKRRAPAVKKLQEAGISPILTKDRSKIRSKAMKAYFRMNNIRLPAKPTYDIQLSLLLGERPVVQPAPDIGDVLALDSVPPPALDADLVGSNVIVVHDHVDSPLQPGKITDFYDPPIETCNYEVVWTNLPRNKNKTNKRLVLDQYDTALELSWTELVLGRSWNELQVQTISSA